MHARALALLRQMLGPQADFRPGQWEAIHTVAGLRERALIVQRTGWGKSVVYFLASKLLRDQGMGPTLLISPLLSLMRNQILMAGRIGVRAATIHSGNREEWDQTEAALATEAIDVLLISPERLNNEHFVAAVLPAIRGGVGLLVIDEAHCISDWGHDFRPDYRRIRRIAQGLPRGVPVLATTATANDRVVEDVRQHLGGDLLVLRGPLARASLRLQNLRIPDQADRLAWLAENVPKFRGSGIVYCLTVADCDRVARWLDARGIRAKAYHAGDDARIDRQALEEDLLSNNVKVLVATVALGMGFDKPDLSFVVHYQRPGSTVAYYQQVGRAGRAVEKAYGILLNGAEDDDIQNYFIDSAFPSPRVSLEILDVLARSDGATMGELLAQLNISRSVAERALKLLEVDGAVGITRDHGAARYFRTPNPWAPDVDRVEQITARRRAELDEIRAYVGHPGCLMEFLARSLDDREARPCGVCANCQSRGFDGRVSADVAAAARAFLRRDDLVLEPRKHWPAGLFPGEKATIPPEHVNRVGRILCYYGDGGWGKLVRDGKYSLGNYPDALVDASLELIRERWRPEPVPVWVTAIPSSRHPKLVADFAARLAERLGLPFVVALGCATVVPEQKTMANSTMQARNARTALSVIGSFPPGPVLLVDDIIDSGWTMTTGGRLLRSRGSGEVHPFALARTVGRITGP
jgi:ATP-dependent DNA helicase RecQ